MFVGNLSNINCVKVCNWIIVCFFTLVQKKSIFETNKFSDLQKNECIWNTKTCISKQNVKGTFTVLLFHFIASLSKNTVYRINDPTMTFYLEFFPGGGERPRPPICYQSVGEGWDLPLQPSLLPLQSRKASLDKYCYLAALVACTPKPLSPRAQKLIKPSASQIYLILFYWIWFI